MRYLLDTHIFLWFISQDKRISDPIRTTICEADEVYLSVVSVWEATIKQQTVRKIAPTSTRAALLARATAKARNNQFRNQ